MIEMSMVNKPPVAKPISISQPELIMAVPAFIEQHGAGEDKNLARELLRISRGTRVLLGQFFHYVAITRPRDFADALKASDAREGVAIVVGSLMRTTVVTIAALFDEDRRTSNIPKMLRTVLHPARSNFLYDFHKQYGVL